MDKPDEQHIEHVEFDGDSVIGLRVNEVAARLECLRLAVIQRTMAGTLETVERAKTFADFVLGNSS